MIPNASLRDEIEAWFQGMVSQGTPWTEDYQCWDFCRDVYALADIELPNDVYQAAREFEEVPVNSGYTDIKFLDAVYFDAGQDATRHIAVVSAYPWAMQCSVSTNGVARIHLLRSPWVEDRKSVHRHKSCL